MFYPPCDPRKGPMQRLHLPRSDPAQYTNLMQTQSLVTRMLESIKTWKRSFFGEEVTRRDASLVANEVNWHANSAHHLGIYLASIAFVAGDAWEVVR